MPKYAQIHNNRVHWVFEHAAKTVAALYDKYFCREHIEIVSLDDTAEVAEGMTAELSDGAYVFTAASVPEQGPTTEERLTAAEDALKALMFGGAADV